MKKINDLANFLELNEDGMKEIRAGLQVIAAGNVAQAKTTLPGGGKTGDATAASNEYSDELEDTTAYVPVGGATQIDGLA
jgi:hypothetical protein